MSKPLTAVQLSRIATCRDHTTWTAEQAAKHLSLPIAEVRRVYAEGRR